MFWIVLLSAGALALSAKGKKGATQDAYGGYSPSATMDNSMDAGVVSAGLSLPVYEPWIGAVMACLADGKSLTEGWLYYWGGPTAKGCPSASRLPLPGGAIPSLWYADCSGGTWSFLVCVGLITPDTPRFTSLIGAPGGVWGKYRIVVVSPDDVRPGDCIEYDGHIVVVVGGSGLACTVMSMSGGGRTTFGQNPNARAKLMKGNYRTIKQIVRLVPA
jgi:hypothetical protein